MFPTLDWHGIILLSKFWGQQPAGQTGNGGENAIRTVAFRIVGKIATWSIFNGTLAKSQSKLLSGWAVAQSGAAAQYPFYILLPHSLKLYFISPKPTDIHKHPYTSENDKLRFLFFVCQRGRNHLAMREIILWFLLVCLGKGVMNFPKYPKVRSPLL